MEFCRCDHVIVEQSKENFQNLAKNLYDTRPPKKTSQKWQNFWAKYGHSEMDAIQGFLSGDFDKEDSFSLMAPKRFLNSVASDTGDVENGDFMMSNCGMVGRKAKTKGRRGGKGKDVTRSTYESFPLFQAVLHQMKNFDLRRGEEESKGIHFIYFDCDNTGNSYKLLLRFIQNLISDYMGQDMRTESASTKVHGKNLI